MKAYFKKKFGKEAIGRGSERVRMSLTEIFDIVKGDKDVSKDTMVRQRKSERLKFNFKKGDKIRKQFPEIRKKPFIGEIQKTFFHDDGEQLVNIYYEEDNTNENVSLEEAEQLRADYLGNSQKFY